MRKFLYFLATALLLVGETFTQQRDATSTITNFTRGGGIYSFDIYARRTGPDNIRIGISSFYLNFNNVALTNPFLTNVNPKYTGTSGLTNDYAPMTVDVIAGKLAITVFFTGNGEFGTGQLLSTTLPDGELICTVNLTITNPAASSNLAWDLINSAITDSRGAPAVNNTFVGSDESPLPIVLSSLTAVQTAANQVRIDWTTESEVDNFGFEVQKSTEAQSGFSTIPNSFVPGNGTTIVPQSYTYTDVTAAPGTWYYRLKQIDFDGDIHYTDAVMVEVVTDVGEEDPVPTVFALDQNYPNPFNPSTMIRFAVPAESRVLLEVYNVIGQKVATLVDEVMPVGFHSVPFNGAELSSGLYFYRFSAGEVSFLRKMMLVK